MPEAIIGLFFITGLGVGSFLNVVIYRVHSSLSFITGRSHCTQCKNLLPWYDLIPVLSFVLLGGKCRRCRKRIALQYPLVELGCGVLFAMGYYLSTSAIELILFLTVSCFFTALFVFDWCYYLVPDQISIPAIVIIALLSVWAGHSVIAVGLGALVGGSWFLAQFFISRGRWVGGGDIRVGILMGVLLGHPYVWLGLGLAYIGGSIIALFLVFAGKKELSGRVPFATMLLPAALVAWIWGAEIWEWYAGLLF